jgi:hypothetical protein
MAERSTFHEPPSLRRGTVSVSVSPSTVASISTVALLPSLAVTVDPSTVTPAPASSSPESTMAWQAAWAASGSVVPSPASVDSVTSSTIRPQSPALAASR